MRILPVLCLTLTSLLPVASVAASCGNTSAGFASWKAEFAAEAKRAGVKRKGLKALAQAQYASRTIAADRNQKSFRYSLEKFMQLRGSATIVAQGRKRKARNPEFYAALEKKYGVPAGVLIAIHGMETAFGHFMGDSQVVSAIVTLTYDCRRSDFFRPHAIGALKLVDQGAITPATLGAKHGELGHTQFLPGNALTYGVDWTRDGRVDFYNQQDALASTANYLRKKGWKRGKGYQPGQPNYKVLKQWNAATVYQQSLAIMGQQIDG
ncbi:MULTISPECIES: lytic murein transglycosylase [Rhodobacterales]|jgi:membrane-bound lytic murein transglycosylase B|uniref:lytic murein transglycosylase n=1 Tax=Rhodobacterales TaxID=204455 RepID=UPI00237F4E55|nr:lytic transglycosylase domain-containing protein [Phaeobacter gallaeciensis]MDE4096687.1 lytic transglycosylase domain-containing protein [Phaeobacter gallaeciensis]MDE4105498.1 lytic transglycosylase domain-containing protein [Phaeobacter gallaeciensis]MDE4109954.1 lytic transglycosylase domain-containing protein [Phaeobacter gallaeciensis]MDE4114422.1 lytic transglycosylase domain-containing protein [Phaeobacter gallaeciensis]MDE4118889.1 lytic transglycosylase domain-containing protein [